jgi:hypothetical protein
LAVFFLFSKPNIAGLLARSQLAFSAAYIQILAQSEAGSDSSFRVECKKDSFGGNRWLDSLKHDND